MLPFLKSKRMDGGIITQMRKPDENSELAEDASSGDMEGLKVAASELIKAIHAGDEDAVASALKSAFDILDSMPHEEGPHENETSEE